MPATLKFASGVAPAAVCLLRTVASQVKIGQPSLLEAAAFSFTSKTPSAFKRLSNAFAGKDDPLGRVVVQCSSPAAGVVDLVAPPGTEGVTTRSFFDETRGS